MFKQFFAFDFPPHFCLCELQLRKEKSPHHVFFPTPTTEPLEERAMLEQLLLRKVQAIAIEGERIGDEIARSINQKKKKYIMREGDRDRDRQTDR